MDDQTGGTLPPRSPAHLVVAVVRALLGWLLAVVGGVLLLGCYLGVSKESDVALQLPYVVSGGFFGISLVALGGAVLVADRIEAARIDQHKLATQVEDLHTLIVASVPGTVGGPAATPTPSARIPGSTPARPVDEPGTVRSALDDGILYAVPAGRTFHRASCELLAGKPAQPVDAAEATARALSPCSVCAPTPIA